MTADPAVDDPTADLPDLTDDSALDAALEALLLVVDAPTEEESLAAALGQPLARVRAALHRLAVQYTADDRGMDLRRVGAGWRFYTRDAYAPFVERLLLDGQRAKLTRAALETLAVVAYRQPVTRARVAAVRGVNCDGVLRTLLTRARVTGWRYATTARVSSAARVSLARWPSSSRRSTNGAKASRV